MKITKVELYDKYYSTYSNLFQGDTKMPNHCYNRVEIYSDNEDDIKDINACFNAEEIFSNYVPEPKWEYVPLEENETRFGVKLGEKGELPEWVEDFGKRLVFKSTGKADDRWYDWRVQNWDTKWDAYDIDVDYSEDNPNEINITFNTAWAPPEAICTAMREKYMGCQISWFYDEPGCEIAGYL